MSVSTLAGAVNVSGNVRGVTFNYLDGAPQDINWVLNNQSDPVVRAKIDALLAQYRAAGVNWIRILVSSDYMSGVNYPNPSQSLISKVNSFMAITRAGQNSGKFQIELVLTPHAQNGLLADAYPYTTDKNWYKQWFDQLDYSNLGMIMMAGDLSPCLLNGCEGDPTLPANAIQRNHGKWIREMWAWKDANYSNLNVSYEVIGNVGGSGNNPDLIKKLAIWNDTNTPSNPILAASLYIDLPSGSQWPAYATAVGNILSAYHSVTGKMLWIDEYGRGIGQVGTDQDQAEAYAGFLGASVCIYQNYYPKFAWVAGNDYPYDGANWFGLVSSFSGTTPVMRPAWAELSLYYNLQSC